MRASASPKPLFLAVAVVFVCWGNAWARASRVSTCVGMYAKPLVPAISSVLHLWGLPDIPRVWVSRGTHTPVGYSFVSAIDESDESNGFKAHLLHVAMLGRPPPNRDRSRAHPMCVPVPGLGKAVSFRTSSDRKRIDFSDMECQDCHIDPFRR